MGRQLSTYISEDLIFFIEQSSKEHILDFVSEQMSKHAVASMYPSPSLHAIHKAILQREKLMSTGIGMGVAIPHAKIPSFPQFIVAIAILQHGIDWNAVDSSLVRLVFMIVGPDDQPAEYLSLLSSLTDIVRRDEARRALMNAQSKEAVKKLFLDYDSL